MRSWMEWSVVSTMRYRLRFQKAGHIADLEQSCINLPMALTPDLNMLILEFHLSLLRMLVAVLWVFQIGGH